MDTVITSAKNPKVKALRHLASSSKARRDENTYIAEGIHLAKSMIETDGEISSYVLAQSALENSEIIELVNNLEEKNIEQTILADSLFESISSIHAGVGILALFTPKNVKIDKVLPLKNNAVLLDDVQDPGNVGTILRTASATGIDQVLLSPGCASPWSQKALRAGMGAQFSLEIYEDVDLASVMKSSTIPVFATTLASDSRSLYELDLTEPTAWLFGSEGQGVSSELAELADARVLIPQAESAVESLNVSSAVAVCLYEQYRQANISKNA